MSAKRRLACLNCHTKRAFGTLLTLTLSSYFYPFLFPKKNNKYKNFVTYTTFIFYLFADFNGHYLTKLWYQIFVNYLLLYGQYQEIKNILYLGLKTQYFSSCAWLVVTSNKLRTALKILFKFSKIKNNSKGHKTIYPFLITNSRWKRRIAWFTN